MPTPVLVSGKRRFQKKGGHSFHPKGLAVIFGAVTIVSFVLLNVTTMEYDRGTVVLPPERNGSEIDDNSDTSNRILQQPTSPPTEPIPDLLVSVPFYVYEELSWINGTIGGNLIVNRNLHHSFNGTNRFKHGDDYFFALLKFSGD